MSNLQAIQEVLEKTHTTRQTIDEKGRTQDIGMTAMRKEQGLALQETVRREGAQRTIETGFAYGVSGLHMVLGALEGGCAQPFHMAMDPFQLQAWNNAGLETFRRAGAEGFLHFEENNSEFVLPELLRNNTEPFDVALVDGAHLFENAFVDLYYFNRLVKEGGLIILDDIWMPGVRWAMDYFVKNLEWTVDHQHPPHPKQPQKRFQKTSPFTGVQHVVFRKTKREVPREWNHFVPFGDSFGEINK